MHSWALAQPCARLSSRAAADPPSAPDRSLGQGRAGQDRAGQDRAGPDRTGPDRTRPNPTQPNPTPPRPAAGRCCSASVPRTGRSPPEPASALSYSKRPINVNDGAAMRCRRRRHCSSQTRAAPRGGIRSAGLNAGTQRPVGRPNRGAQPQTAQLGSGPGGSPVWAPLQSRSYSPKEPPLCHGTHSAGIVRLPQSSPSEPAELLMKNGILSVGRCRFHTEQTLPSQLSAS